MKKILIFALFSVFLCSGRIFAATFDPSLNWQTIKTDHFEIHYAASLDAQARLSAKYLEEAHAKLSPKFDWSPWGRTQIILTDTYDSANGLTSTLPYNFIILRMASPDPDSILAYYDNWLRSLIFHEYAHVLHIDQYGGVMTVPHLVFGKIIAPNGTVPGWMREGIATYIETSQGTAGRGRASFSEMMLRTATLAGKFPKIDQADGLGWRWPTYHGMYIYGVEFLQYLVDRFGEEKLMEFHKKMGHSPMLYAVNHQAKRVFNETFYDLWDEWRVSLDKKYAEEKAVLEKQGLTEFEDVAKGETILSSPAVSPDGKYLAYARAGAKGPSELRLIDLATGEDKVIIKKRPAAAISFSPDSKKIIYSSSGVYKSYNSFSDIYTYDLETKKILQLTKGERASDPFFSPDGKKVAYVKQNAGAGWLAVSDADFKETVVFGEREMAFAQFSAPSWSPDGKYIAVSSWQLVEPSHQTGQWDIYLYDAKTGKKVAQLTDDAALDTHPVWSKDGRTIYFASDRTGINNIYKIDPFERGALARQRAGGGRREVQVTNVLTGAFQPAISPDGKSLYVQYYSGKGFEIKKTKTTHILRASAPAAGESRSENIVLDSAPLRSNNIDFDPSALKAKKYTPFGKSLFLPRFIIPGVTILGDTIYLGAFTGGADPLRRHNWMGGVSYRTDLSSDLGYSFSYWYNRYKPALLLGIMGYAVDFGNLTFAHADGTTNTVHLFEQRRRLYGGFSYPFNRQSAGLSYYWEERSPRPSLRADEAAALNLGNFSGFTVSYAYSQYEKYPASISNERGRKLKANFSITDEMTGSSSKNEQRILVGDFREYISLPWANHVLAFRTSGGMTWGDELIQGTFSLGGALGEGMMGGGDSLYYFPLRGLPIAALSRTRALLFSGEYRVPLASPQRGAGTLPFYLENIHFAPFVDYGNAWSSSTDTWGNGKYFFNNFFLGTGAEIRGDFVTGHGLPITGRLGYGIILVNRDRLGSVVDPLIGTSIKNGMLVLQLGTAF